MKTVKTRKQGNSLTITIPKNFDVDIDAEFIPIKKENGALLYVPVVKDFFENAGTDEFYHPELVMDYQPIGAENHAD